MKPIEITLEPEWLATLDVLAKKEDPPVHWPPGEASYSNQERATFASQQPALHEIILETLRETRPEEELAALYDNAERMSLEDLRSRFRELTIDRERCRRERHDEERRRIARMGAFYDMLMYCEWQLEGGHPSGLRRHEDPFEGVREDIRGLADTLCP